LSYLWFMGAALLPPLCDPFMARAVPNPIPRFWAVSGPAIEAMYQESVSPVQQIGRSRIFGAWKLVVLADGERGDDLPVPLVLPHGGAVVGRDDRLTVAHRGEELGAC